MRFIRTEYCLATAKTINLTGKEMLPCFSCSSGKRKYIVLNTKSKRYSEYIRLSLLRYNVNSIPIGNLLALNNKVKRLCIKRKTAFKQAAKYSRLVTKSIVRADRLKK